MYCIDGVVPKGSGFTLISNQNMRADAAPHLRRVDASASGIIGREAEA